MLVSCVGWQVTARGADASAPEFPRQTERVPGVELAEDFTQITGVAISPLLGVSASGAWRYEHTPAGQRDRLPWFCHPYVWGTGFFLLALCLLKDVFGTVAPPLLKKPLDVAELFENKASALVASTAFVPFVAAQMARYAPQPTALVVSHPLPLASSLFAGVFDARLIAIPLAIVGFLVVWLSCHAINVIIVLCPFGFIDGLLKLFKGLLLFSVVASSFISPYLGAAVSLFILFLAVLIAPWAFRLTVFGTLFGLDILLPGRSRQRARPSEPHAFLARKLGAVPSRTYGRLTRPQIDTIGFTYRPWLLFPERTVTLPTGSVIISKGLLFPSLLHDAGNQRRPSVVVLFLPRYRSQEHSIALHFEVSEVRDSPLLRGFRAVRDWLAETFQLGRAKYLSSRDTPAA